jgi:hypothetical protein
MPHMQTNNWGVRTQEDLSLILGFRRFCWDSFIHSAVHHAFNRLYIMQQSITDVFRIAISVEEENNDQYMVL